MYLLPRRKIPDENFQGFLDIPLDHSQERLERLLGLVDERGLELPVLVDGPQPEVAQRHAVLVELAALREERGAVGGGARDEPRDPGYRHAPRAIGLGGDANGGAVLLRDHLETGGGKLA